MYKSLKEWLEAKGINEEAYGKKTAEEMAALHKEYMQYVNDETKAAFAKMVSKDDLQAAIKDLASKNAIEGLAKAEDLSKVEKSAKEALEKASQALEQEVKDRMIQSFASQVKAEILKNKEGWAKLKDSPSANVSMTVKVVGDMLISTNTTGRVARIEIDTERPGVARRMPFVMDLVGRGNTNANTIYWVEREGHEGAVTFVAEGAAKPQIDWNYVERSAAVKKLAGHVKISKEMLDDIDGISQDIAEELTEQLQLLADASLLTGDGTSNTLTGIAENATAFAPGSALANLVVSANEMDALRAAVAQVYRNNFAPNYIVVHPDKLALMDLKKGDDDHYLLPPFVTANGTTVAGIPVVANNGVAADAFYVGDFTKYKVKVREDISIQIGYENDDWTKNFVTPLAEMRLVGYIKSNHYGAIVTGTFTVAKALLDPAVSDS